MRNNARRGVVVACALALAWVMAVPAFGSEPVIKLKYANFMPPVHKHSVLIEEWCKEVEKQTNGRVKITHFPGTTLAPANQIYDAVVKGIADIGHSILSYTPGRQPLSDVIALPLGYKRGSQVSRMANAYYQKFKPKELDDVKVFFLMGPGPFIWHTKEPVNKIDDLKGLRIKSDANTSKIVAAAGAVPTTMPMSETYDAIKRGLAEGVLNPIETLKGWKFGDVAKYTYENYGSANSNNFFVAMNKEKWASLPPDIQQIFEKTMAEWFEKHAKTWDEIDEEGREYALKMGHKFTKATPQEEAQMQERMKPVLEAYVKAMKEKDLPGDEVLKFCQEFLKANP
jgi:TRAP-type C4-dicarboxylate transport system substrate-binding protein